MTKKDFLIVVIMFSLLWFVLMRIISKYKPPGACIWRLVIGGIFCVSDLGGFYMKVLIHGGAYFRNFMISLYEIIDCHLQF